MLKHCAANRKRRLSALLHVGPYIYTTLKFMALQAAPYIHDISRLRVNCHMLDLEFFYTISFEKCSISFYLSLLLSRFLMRVLGIFDYISLNSSRDDKCSEKFVEKIKTHILCSITIFFFFEKSSIYERMW
jgi:hypothetical protein